MDFLKQIHERIEARFPGAATIIENTSPSGQHSLLLSHDKALEVAKFLKTEDGLKFDYCSNVSGVDWMDREEVKKIPDPENPGKTIEKKDKIPGYLEAVYHLYSIELKQGPLILRLRTQDRSDNHNLPSLTPVWRGCEFQEREIYDLFGIHFSGHPDLRRILMWDEFKDYPMRKDYVEPDDYEWEPTAHGVVLEKHKHHLQSAAATQTQEPAQ